MSVTFDSAATIAHVRAVIARMHDLVPLYDVVGAYAANKIRDRIQNTKKSPEGDPWAPWKPFTEVSRQYSGNMGQGLLWDTGDLLNSIRFDVDGNFGVEIGTDVHYAVDLHEGIAGKQEARPLVGWAREDYAVVLSAATSYFNSGITGHH